MKLLKWTIATIITFQVLVIVISVVIGAIRTADYSVSCMHVDNSFFTQHNYSGNTPFNSFKAGKYQAKGSVFYCRVFNYFN